MGTIAVPRSQVPAAPNWLWGDWISTLVGDNAAAYMVLAEGPICCVGTLGLLIMILGLVMMISGTGRSEEYDAEEEEYEFYPEWEEQDLDYG